MLSKSQKNYGESHLTVKILDCDSKYASSTLAFRPKLTKGQKETMIRIMNSNDRISVEGHADYGPHGKDIVFSAISTLLQA